jgi:subtilase family serine protease
MDGKRITRKQNEKYASVIVLVLLTTFAVLPFGSIVSASRDSESIFRPLIVFGHGISTSSPVGYTPAQMRHAYGIDQLGCSFTKPWGSPALCGSGQTTAIVDVFDDPNIESDLGVFDNQFGIPACTTSNGCFAKAQPQGPPDTGNRGATNFEDWALETSLDVEWAHAIAPGARIMLVEAVSPDFTDSSCHLCAAAAYAATQPGVHQVSMSFGAKETSFETLYDKDYQATGVSFIASSGDIGNIVQTPGASPSVVGVGGTSLKLDSSGKVLNETAWNRSGGGISVFESQPIYQQNYGISSNGKRGIPDVSYDADPNTGVPVYDTFGWRGLEGWLGPFGGTSMGAPQWSALFAIVNSGRATPLSSASFGTDNQIYRAATGSAYATNYRDITLGSNGSCGTICNAGPGYDFVTGIGSPKANNLVPFLQTTN